MNDDDLRQALSRRASQSMSNDDRNGVIRAARLQATAPRQRVVPRLAGLVTAMAAVIVLVIVALPILLSPPSPVAPPSPSNQTKVYSGQELSDMIGNPSWVGRTVLANASVSVQPTTGLGCSPPSPCFEAVLDSVTGANTVSVAWRDDARFVGTAYQDDSGSHWAQLVDVPAPLGVYAFTVQKDSVELLGPAKLKPDGQPLTLAEVPTATEQTPTENVYVVHGWWWAGLWPNCPANPQSPPVELNFFCNGFWLTTSRPESTSTMVSPQDGLLLAAGEYPAWSDQHSPGAPVEGVFLIRSAGCQLTLDNRCPVWRLLGKLDDHPDSSTPSATAVTVPPTETPEPSSEVALPIASAQQLADMIGDSNWVGKAVLADLGAGEIQHDPCGPQPPSPSVNPCERGSLSSVHGPYTSVIVGVRDATSHDGTQYDADGSGYRWVTPLAWPSDAGTYAFIVGQDSVEYLGPINNASALSVVDLSSAKSDPSDTVYVVSGWLMHTLEAPCAFPQQGLESPMPDISSFYCGGSWLTDEAIGSPTSGLTIDGGLHVQGDAYDTYAPDPQPADGGGTQPRQGIYLVRNAGCLEVVTGDCPVWRMVGRLDSQTSASPIPTPSVGASNTADLGAVTFEYPSDWHLSVINEFQHYAAILAFATSPSANAQATCGPDYVPGAGGTCTHTYDLPDGGMVVRVDTFSLPGNGVDLVAHDIANGWAPATAGGMAAAYRDSYSDSATPTVGHSQAWIVAAPGDDITTYTIIVTDNGYANAAAVIDLLISSFTIEGASTAPSPPSATTPPESLLIEPLRESDSVKARGVVRGSDADGLQICEPGGQLTLGRQSPTPPGTPACPADVGVPLTGVSSATLPGWSAIGTGGETSLVEVSGTWTGNSIAVASVQTSDSVPFAQPGLPAECAAPTTGWPGDVPSTIDGESALRTLQDAVDSEPTSLIGYWAAYENPSNSDSAQVMVVGVVGDAAGTQTQLDSIYPYNLCVVPVDYSAADLAAVANGLEPMTMAWQPSVDETADRVVIDLPFVDDAALQRVSSVADKILFDPMVEKVAAQ